MRRHVSVRILILESLDDALVEDLVNDTLSVGKDIKILPDVPDRLAVVHWVQRLDLCVVPVGQNSIQHCLQVSPHLSIGTVP